MTTKQARYKERKPWVRLVEYARRRCNGKHTRPDTRERYRGVPCTITADEAEILWDRAQARHMICPSLDRIDSRKGYTLENCRIIERDLNSRLAWDKNIATTLDQLLPESEN